MITTLTDIGTGYSQAEILDTLLRGSRTVRFRYLLLTSDFNPIGYLETVTDCSLSYNYLAETKLTGKMTMVEGDDTDGIDWQNQFIQPYFDLLMDDGLWLHQPLGVLTMSTPERVSGSGAVVRTIDCYDLAQLLRQTGPDYRYAVAVGQVITSTINDILTDMGLQTNIADSPYTVNAARSWDIGTSWKVIINDLLSMMGYGSLWFDQFGKATAAQYVEPALRQATIEYYTDEASVLAEEATLRDDYFQVPNKWVLTVSQPDRAVLTSTFTNSNPTSPTSTVNRRFTITKFDSTSDATTQDALDLAVKQMAAEDSQVYQEFEFRTAMMPPFHWENTTVAVQHDPQGLVKTTYCEITWDLNLKAGASMSHKVRRAVDIG